MADSHSTQGKQPRKRSLPSGMWDRNGVYWSRFRQNGRVVRTRLGTNYRVACDLLAELKARAVRGQYGVLDNGATLDEVQRAFLRVCDQTLRPGTCRRYRGRLATVRRGLPARFVREVKPAVVVDYRAARVAEGRCVTTVNGEVTTLRRMFQWACDNELIASNPLDKFKRLRADTLCKERRALTLDEVQRLLDASPPRLRAVWLTFLSTGMRRTELTSMRFEDVDYENSTIRIRRETSKTHKERFVPCSQEVLAIIRDLEASAPFRHPVDGPTEAVTRLRHRRFTKSHVFVTLANGRWGDTLLRRFYCCARRAGIADAKPGGAVDLHSLRVSFITLSMNNGAKPKAVSLVVGHSRLSLTLDIYTKASAADERDAVAALPFATMRQPDHVAGVVGKTAHGARTRTAELQKTPRKQA